MPIRTVDLDLVEQREGHFVGGGTKLFDFLVAARFLAAELIARETQRGKTFVLVFLLQGLERGVLRRVTASRGDIDDQRHLALIRFERGALAIDVLHRKGVDGIRGLEADYAEKKQTDESKNYFHGRTMHRTGPLVNVAVVAPQRQARKSLNQPHQSQQPCIMAKIKFLTGLLLITFLSPGFCAGSPKKITTVEGITEYQLDNGLRVLLFPENSRSKVTVNMTVLVGSRHEGYGETGMAHLLEHMVFKGTPQHPNVPKALNDHGAQWNGSTSSDRTNYYETMADDDE